MTNSLDTLIRHRHVKGYGMNLAKIKKSDTSLQYPEKKKYVGTSLLKQETIYTIPYEERCIMFVWILRITGENTYHIGVYSNSFTSQFSMGSEWRKDSTADPKKLPSHLGLITSHVQWH